MKEPSNSNLESPTYINIATDKERKALRLEIHFVTAYMQPHEVADMIRKMFKVGVDIYGVEWASNIFTELGMMPIPIEGDVGC